MAISEELKAVYATAPTDRHYVECMSLAHPAFDNGVRNITNHNGGWVGLHEDGYQIAYEYAPFAAIPPKAADEAAINMQVAIDNASRTLIAELEKLAQFPSQPINVTYRVYLSSDPLVLQNDPPLKLSVSSVTASQDVVTFAATLTNLRDRPFPSQLYTTVLYPGLAR